MYNEGNKAENMLGSDCGACYMLGVTVSAVQHVWSLTIECHSGAGDRRLSTYGSGSRFNSCPSHNVNIKEAGYEIRESGD